ncbi:hypothetical protein, partial [Streptomyces sp. NPDC048845]|uniref:hypothetical protein n=1 Tax=Streptomyces sp. NPDC048845 TaxID=3155390 RepID=UPI00343E801E
VRAAFTPRDARTGARPGASRAAGRREPGLPGPRGAIGPVTAASGPLADDEPDGPCGDGGYGYVRLMVLRAALAAARPRRPWNPAGWYRRAGAALLLPRVWGLRLFPRSGGADQLALDEALAEVPAAARAAYVLRGLERLPDREVRRLLAAAGVTAPAAALERADAVAVPVGSRDEQLLESAEFDPCSLQARPTDLLLRRRHVRAAFTAAAAVAVCGSLLVLPGGRPAAGDRAPDRAVTAPPAAAHPAVTAALDPSTLLRAAPGAWRDADRPGFAHWPARGERTDDRELLGRALAAWARPSAVTVSATPGTASGPPPGPARLLFAGDVERTAVVLLHDGLRVVRYAEPLDPRAGSAVLDLARADAADTASAAALVLHRDEQHVRHLTAPWVTGGRLRDLLRPDAAPRPLDRSEDGVTAPAPTPATARECDSWPAMELRTDPSVPAPAALLLTDLGELTPAELTYGEPGAAAASRPAAPGTGTGTAATTATGPTGTTGAPAAAATPAAVSTPAARTSWARSACELAGLRATGVRSVNSWRFAVQPLPDGSGSGDWLCTRAETWRGGGSRVSAQFQPPAERPGAPGTVAARATDSPACGARRPQVLAGVLWRSAAGRWYVLAAGSPQVVSVRTTGDGGVRAAGRLLSVPADGDTRAGLRGRLADGAELTALD